MQRAQGWSGQSLDYFFESLWFMELKIANEACQMVYIINVCRILRCLFLRGSTN